MKLRGSWSGTIYEKLSALGLRRKSLTMKHLEDFSAGSWRASAAAEALPVVNPAAAEVLAEVPLLPAEEIPAAAETSLMGLCRVGPAAGRQVV
jgi:hypothetical protein